MTARFLVGDTRERLTEIPDGSIDFLVTSPPFLALRSYLPEGHPDKGKEIGSEPTPAAFIDVMLALTAAWGRVLAPHGSLAVELGDTYAGSGGAGGDYADGMWRDGQEVYTGSASRARKTGKYTNEKYGGRNPIPSRRPPPENPTKGEGWPLAKSLACIPQLYQVALAYGINPLTGAPSPAGRWRVRNLKSWIRSNPPVGALGDKERPATSYVIVACRATDRYFDLDAVRTPYNPLSIKNHGGIGTLKGGDGNINGPKADQQGRMEAGKLTHEGGAPPRDWWHTVDAVLDQELAARNGKPNGHGPDRGTPQIHDPRDSRSTKDRNSHDPGSTGAQGVHLRRALEKAGILTTLEALDVSPRGYSGAHYAVWPPELVRLLIDEMCPSRVCATCGQPSRRLVGEAEYVRPNGERGPEVKWGSGIAEGKGAHTHKPDGQRTRVAPTLGWSDCGHNTWRPGHVLDPFAGSGTTLAVATGMGRTATGIDIDERNADLALERCGMFLEVIDRPTAAVCDPTQETP